MAKNNLFNTIKLTKPKRNVFDLSHDVKLTMDMGELVPILVQECLPGDKFNISGESLIRFAPLISPVMHRMDVTLHYFFVPNRILWKGWENFITGKEERVAPYINVRNAYHDSYPLLNYMGVPAFPNNPDVDLKVSALPFAAYQKIYNDYYRDQNLIPDLVPELNDGNNGGHTWLYPLRKRAWEHDYFTSALPWAQKGAQVELPLAGFTDVEVVRNADNTGGDFVFKGTGSDSRTATVPNSDLGTQDTRLYAKTSEMAGGNTSINDLRKAFRLQEWLEKNARAGSRYIESVLAHFGVKSSDARLNRPEYITGVKTPVVISEVLNTTGENGGLPQGNMAGHGVSVASGKYGKYFCEEHGFIIGIMSVMPLPAYQQGLDRKFTKFDKLDYYWPEFANIGEQEILNQELYADALEADRKKVFGYIPRYSEYRYNPNRVAGDFRGNLDFWHLGRKFANQPSLNKSFIECDPSKRIFAVTSANDSLYIQVLNRIQAIRPLPKFGQPSF